MDNYTHPRDTEDIVISYFIPDEVLMGSRIPIHIIWRKDASLTRILICYSKELFDLKEIYNVEEKGITFTTINEGKECAVVDINALETNGYIGAVLASKFLDNIYIETECSIELLNDNEIVKQISRRIKLFRPYIVAEKIPETIKVEVFNEQPKLSNRIILNNIGYGTAFLKFTLDSDSDVTMLRPEEMHEFITNFLNYFSTRLQDMKKNFPEYYELLSNVEKLFQQLLEGTYEFSEEWLNFVRSTIDDLVDALNRDEEFAKAFSSALIGAYLSAITIITEFRSLYEYLNSLASKRIILVNAFDILELQPGIHRIKGKIEIHDLAGNIHKPIAIEMKIHVNSNCRINIPIYELFEWR